LAAYTKGHDKLPHCITHKETLSSALCTTLSSTFSSSFNTTFSCSHSQTDVQALRYPSNETLTPPCSATYDKAYYMAAHSSWHDKFPHSQPHKPTNKETNGITHNRKTFEHAHNMATNETSHDKLPHSFPNTHAISSSLNKTHAFANCPPFYSNAYKKTNSHTNKETNNLATYREGNDKLPHCLANKETLS